MDASILRSRERWSSDSDEEEAEESRLAWAAGALEHHGMTRDEILAVLTTDEPLVVHRYMELHRERLEEWLAEAQRALVAVEVLLAEAAGERRFPTKTRTGSVLTVPSQRPPRHQPADRRRGQRWGRQRPGS